MRGHPKTNESIVWFSGSLVFVFVWFVGLLCFALILEFCEYVHARSLETLNIYIYIYIYIYISY